MPLVDTTLLGDLVRKQIEVQRNRLENELNAEDTANARGKIRGLRFVLAQLEDIESQAADEEAE